MKVLINYIGPIHVGLHDILKSKWSLVPLLVAESLVDTTKRDSYKYPVTIFNFARGTIIIINTSMSEV